MSTHLSALDLAGCVCNEFRDDKFTPCIEDRDMSDKHIPSGSVIGNRLRERREALGLAQEKVGVAIGLDESAARARISRYELCVHEPPYATVQLLASVLQVPTPYMYCEADQLAQHILEFDHLILNRKT